MAVCVSVHILASLILSYSVVLSYRGSSVGHGHLMKRPSSPVVQSVGDQRVSLVLSLGDCAIPFMNKVRNNVIVVSTYISNTNFLPVFYTTFKTIEQLNKTRNHHIYTG